MAEAVRVQQDADPELDREAMIMMIPRYLWDVLCMQAKAENTTPAMILDQALQDYLGTKGAKEAVDHLWNVAKRNGGV